MTKKSNIYRTDLIWVLSVECNIFLDRDYNEAIPFYSTIYVVTELIVATALLDRAFPLINYSLLAFISLINDANGSLSLRHGLALTKR